MTSRWPELTRALAELSPAEPPRGARVAAALALLADTTDGDLELLLTRRRDDLRHHPGQISLPGGRVEPGESTQEAALREAAEECGLDPATVEVLGSLPAFYIAPSRFWLQVVVGRWRERHALRRAEGEVAEILTARLSTLTDERRWRMVRRIHRGHRWAWQLDRGQLLWGATGAVAAALLDLLVPGWHGGRTPTDLPPEREVRPWAGPEAAVPQPGPARLAGMRQVPVTRAAVEASDALADAAGLCAEAAAQLVAPGEGATVLVLAGPGRTGALGLDVAARLLAGGVEVRAVLASAETHTAGADARRRLGDRVTEFDGSLPGGDLVVDALLGRGLRGALRSPVREVVLALRAHPGRVMSIDLPSGIHPRHGLVGELVSADVTLSLGSVPTGLLGEGLGPFVGDLYVAGAATDSDDPIVRIVPADGDERALA